MTGRQVENDKTMELRGLQTPIHKHHKFNEVRNMIHSSGPAPSPIQTDTHAANATEAPTYLATQQTLGQRFALRCHKSINRVFLRFMGARATFLRAAATNDVLLIRRMVSEHPSAHGWVTSYRVEDKLDDAAAKAVANGKTDALVILLEHGACPNEALIGRNFCIPPKRMFFDERGRRRQHHVTDKLTPETVRILLNNIHICPDATIRLGDSWGHYLYFTAKELINSNSGHKNREEICKMLVSHDQVNVNTEISFYDTGAFALSSKVDNQSFYRHPRSTFINVNFIGQTLMFDNFGLTEHLLTDQTLDLDPGLPSGTGAAENLLVIFMDKYSKGYFRKLNDRFDILLTALKDKITNSDAFRNQLLASENKLFKQQFLTLFAIEHQCRHAPSPTDFQHLNCDQLNDEILDIFMNMSYETPPDYHLLYPNPPPSYD
ncbi:hypothetical protein [Endozoicomonas sp. YOMI1]|uniref:hypothetical protein n=1 Tax=Endozoicomonas sp. YOMI1 TaxID=2828739 RepID=UPI002148E2C4|nr:hypothetical protein [Endozoicomonas sp. YOMI1]